MLSVDKICAATSTWKPKKIGEIYLRNSTSNDGSNLNVRAPSEISRDSDVVKLGSLE